MRVRTKLTPLLHHCCHKRESGGGSQLSTTRDQAQTCGQYLVLVTSSVSLSGNPPRERLTKYPSSSPTLIRFSDQAEKRTVERLVVAEEVEMAIRNPLEAIPAGYGSKLWPLRRCHNGQPFGTLLFLYIRPDVMESHSTRCVIRQVASGIAPPTTLCCAS
jgi:hypothetical protein